ncbi:MAG TPA: NAD(P)H-binding protein [Ktedonobacteraceae bacterium]
MQAEQEYKEAVADVDTIIHAATNAGVTLEDAKLSTFLRKSLLKHDDSVDVGGTRLLLEQAHIAGVGHFIYVSIVGIERLPFAYYRDKLRAEELVQKSDVPWSMARATQFHSLINTMVQQSAGWPAVILATDLLFQPVYPGDVADHLCALIRQGPAGRLPDFGGPEVLKLGDMARAWLEIHGQRKPIWNIPLPGKTAKALRQCGLTNPQEKHGTVTWAEWLQRTVESSRYDNRVTSQH